VVSGPRFVEVPAGVVWLGSDPSDAGLGDADEAPAHRVAVAAFRISRVPVTNARYAAFVAATGWAKPGHWEGGAVPAGKEEWPVTYVSLTDAEAYCAWAGARLPTEAEWERAARGDDARTWPWGDEAPAPRHARFGGTPGSPCPVGTHPDGASRSGVLDLAGNVWEWTSSADRPYPYDATDGREAADPWEDRVVRGGSYIHDAADIRCAARHPMLPGVTDPYLGFRVCASVGASPVVEHDWVDVPAGEVLLGTDPPRHPGGFFPGEEPRHAVEVACFELGLTPVTNEQYASFVAATGHAAPLHWRDGAVPAGLGDHPVTCVSWHDARAFCAWAGGRLPTEAEWERAARGDGDRPYPWGTAQPDERLATFGRGTKRRSTTPVGAHPLGAGPFGGQDLAGNVWEWASSAHRPYPYRGDDGREDPASPEERVLRGGSYASPGAAWLRCAFRSKSHPTRRQSHVGFRVVRDTVREERA
jgi:formylglycine-generating enzyme required for sulfatase activity